MRLFDSHCHLDDERFNEDRADVIAHLQEKEVTRCCCVGSDLPSSHRCIALAKEYDFICAAAGVHPHEAKDAPADYLDQLRELLQDPCTVALGEIGLDYYYDLSPRDVQKRVAQEQLELAFEMDMPVIFPQVGPGERVVQEFVTQVPEGIAFLNDIGRRNQHT